MEPLSALFVCCVDGFGALGVGVAESRWLYIFACFCGPL